ncbi:WcbI family polysaccharide biosynthesis putative acetyltransferase [Nakamurella deserti]|uniref:WcbI family polysaccharide biosynthesis putative acetyltransferase n=1 Tax=Nakamurella deserti TaxID=2164074 RepID=UPI000DBE400D|nr:WcbI family polysaccharide biosynthesis putative acetyltransferase [Nakamurella deserti]
MSTIDGRTRHYGTFYGLPDDPEADLASGPVVLVHGNCQAEAMRQLIAQSPELHGRTIRIPPVFELTADDLPHLERLLARCDVLVSQPVRDGYRDLTLGTRELAGLLPAGARVVRWPVLRFAGLHPWQVIVRDPRDPGRNPPVVPYHDLRTLAAAAGRVAGPTADGAFRAVADASRAELARREDRDCDVSISDLFAAPRAGDMLTVNHPGNRILVELARRLQEAIGVAPVAADPGRVLLGEVVAPVEAPVLAALGIDADPVDHWTVRGERVGADTVHAAQQRWYLDNPWVLDAGMQRHADTLALLGLT